MEDLIRKVLRTTYILPTDDGITPIIFMIKEMDAQLVVSQFLISIELQQLL